jgi:hypothetical protein
MKNLFPRRFQLLAAMNAARERGDLDAFYQLQDEHLRELTGAPGRLTLDGLEDRLERLDARRKEAPGQMGLDFTGSGQGPGGGEPCGNSWIDPNKECHKGAGGGAAAGEAPAAAKPAAKAKTKPKAAAPIDASQPFSKEKMEQIVAGIEQRAYAPQAARHNGTDLALALQKLAEAPGLTGEHAREAMAFMDEVGAVVMITPLKTFAPELKVSSDAPPRWDDAKSPDENKAALDSYFLERNNAAERGRNFAERVGLWPNDLVETLKADRSPHGEAMAGLILRARDGTNLNGTPLGNMERFKEKQRELTAALDRYATAAPGEERERAMQNAKNLYEEVRFSSFTGGPDNRLDNVRGALEKVLNDPGTYGHYWPGGNVYWKVSMAGVNGSRLNPDEVQLSGMQPLLANNINVQEKSRVFSFSNTPGLKESEKALSTHLHELGHLIHDAAGRSVQQRWNEPGMEIHFHANSMDLAPPNVRKLLSEGRGPTRYSNTNVAELFAESFVAYVAAPNAFKTHNPELYDWVQRTTKKARRTAVASREASNWYLQ